MSVCPYVIDPRLLKVIVADIEITYDQASWEWLTQIFQKDTFDCTFATEVLEQLGEFLDNSITQIKTNSNPSMKFNRVYFSSIIPSNFSGLINTIKDVFSLGSYIKWVCFYFHYECFLNNNGEIAKPIECVDTRIDFVRKMLKKVLNEFHLADQQKYVKDLAITLNTSGKNFLTKKYRCNITGELFQGATLGFFCLASDDVKKALIVGLLPILLQTFPDRLIPETLPREKFSKYIKQYFLSESSDLSLNVQAYKIDGITYIFKSTVIPAVFYYTDTSSSIQYDIKEPFIQIGNIIWSLKRLFERASNVYTKSKEVYCCNYREYLEFIKRTTLSVFSPYCINFDLSYAR